MQGCLGGLIFGVGLAFVVWRLWWLLFCDYLLFGRLVVIAVGLLRLQDFCGVATGCLILLFTCLC